MFLMQELHPADLPVRHAFALEFLARMEVMNSDCHGTFCGQIRPISLSKALSIHKISRYGQRKIYSQNAVPAPLHSAKVTLWCRLTTSFIVGLLFFEEVGPAVPLTVPSIVNAMESFAQPDHYNTSTACMSG
ncbi:uncharacterized protein CEXT_415981 [Caerostris extrusa]|uniref:Uncharacterized protein n=1 Tax=Caerostris extrusa TaxID=172846 RepID=A0AAV4SCD3_CAEEX|nr:uncharacterized protein CEXT_415981 [Caerostris extrusa]